MKDSVLILCEDVNGYGRERCEVDVRVLEESDRGGNGRCEYGRDEHVCGNYGRYGNGHGVNGRFHVGDLHGNDLSGHVHHASAHAHDARGRTRSCL